MKLEPLKKLVLITSLFCYSFSPFAVAAAQDQDADDAAAGQASAYDNDEAEMDRITVQAPMSRLPASLDTFPGSVTRIDSAEIEAGQALQNDAGSLLTLLVPGMGEAARGSASNFEQTIRGRKAAVLIDGVPISTPLRDGRHDVRSLSLSALDSVEVIRGASALYGNGGVGGVINYVTRQPREEGLRWTTRVGTEVSLTEPGDSLAPFVQQSVAGRQNNLDFVGDVFFQRTNSLFDADGDRIRPSPQGQGGVADSDIVSLFGKVGRSFGPQRLEASALYFRKEQDSDFNRIVLGDPAAGIKTRVERGELPAGASEPSDENLVLQAAWSHQDVLGSAVRLQGFYQSLENVFDYFPTFFPGGGQSAIDSTKYGARLDITTALDFSAGPSGELLWGLDLLSDETAQPLVDGRIWAPGIEQDSAAVFAQARLELTDRLGVSGGIRHEQIEVSFPSFQALFSGDQVEAGETDYDTTTVNAGLSFRLTDPLVAFAGYSEGFSVAEVGAILRQAGEETDFGLAELEASKVRNREIGLRWHGDGFHASIAAFETRSNLGTTITTDLRIARQKEETWGIEVTAEGRLSERLRVSGSVSWIDGDRDADGDGSLDRPLPSNVIPPVKVVGVLDYDLSAVWAARLQARYSGSRDPFDQVQAFGESPIDAYTLVDASVSANLAQLGRLTLGINNLFNKDYFPLASQLFACCADRFSAGPGRSAQIAWTMEY